MSKPFYVNYDQPEGLASDALALLETVSADPANIRKGTNETTKSIERSEAKLVFIALDVDPPEIVAHLPLLCKDKKIAYLYINSKAPQYEVDQIRPVMEKVEKAIEQKCGFKDFTSNIEEVCYRVECK